MQRRDARDLLEDVLAACGDICVWTDAHTREEFMTDTFARRSIERTFEIIGEALKRIIKQEPHLIRRFASYNDIIQIRNMIVHGYFLVDPELTWRVVSVDVPVLRTEVQQLLAERPSLP